MPESSPVIDATGDPFDALYLSSRRRLILQCFALTGDLTAARAGVRTAFIAARQQWHRVGALPDPESWIRQRAMSSTQRHHAPHRRRSEASLTDKQAAVLRCLAECKDADRKALILFHLAGLDPARVGRELAITEKTARERISRAQELFTRHRDCQASQILDELRVIAPLVTHPGLPRPNALHSRAASKTRNNVILGTLGAILLATFLGFIVKPMPQAEELALIDSRPLTPTELLTAQQVSAVLGTAGWQETRTDNNSGGTGINHPCQLTRYADPQARRILVRQFSGTQKSSLVQTATVSNNILAAEKSYETALSWFSDCTQERAQVLSASRIQGVADDGWLLRVAVSGVSATATTNYQAVILRQGYVISTLVQVEPRATGKATSDTTRFGELSRIMAQNVCHLSAALACKVTPKARLVVSVPPPVEYPGMLATVDLPTLRGVTRPWVGTRPVAGGSNVAATACDATTFSGATTKARTFVIPGAGLPQSFGLTETIATYPTTSAAKTAAAKISSMMGSCKKRQIGTLIENRGQRAATPLGPAVTIWYEQAQVNANRQMIIYWTGLSQKDRRVIQVTLTPVKGADIDTAAFMALVARAGERLTQTPT